MSNEPIILFVIFHEPSMTFLSAKKTESYYQHIAPKNMAHNGLLTSQLISAFMANTEKEAKEYLQIIKDTCGFVIGYGEADRSDLIVNPKHLEVKKLILKVDTDG